MVTITNNFHSTAIRLRAIVGDELTPAQIKRARRTLCGIYGCTCGGNLGERGPQDVAIKVLDIDRVRLIAKT